MAKYSGRRNGLRTNTKWSDVDLGKRSDKAIAAEIGVSESAVSLARRQRKIRPAPKPVLPRRTLGIFPWRPLAFDRPTELGRSWWRRAVWPPTTKHGAHQLGRG